MVDRERVTELMHQFSGLPSKEQKELYAALSPDEQLEMEILGLKRMWRSEAAQRARTRARERAERFEQMAEEARANRSPGWRP
jgi:hypothetical protein